MSDDHPMKIYAERNSGEVLQKELVARELIRAYILFRRQQFPEYRLDMQRWPQEHWLDVADHVIALRGSPYQYVAIAFEIMPTYPQPNQLKCDLVTNHYRHGTKARRMTAETWIRTQAGYIQNLRKSKGLSPGEILVHPWFTEYFDPLFAYALACDLKDPHLQQRFKSAAKQYQRLHPEAAQVLAAYLPEDFPCKK